MGISVGFRVRQGVFGREEAGAMPRLPERRTKTRSADTGRCLFFGGAKVLGFVEGSMRRTREAPAGAVRDRPKDARPDANPTARSKKICR